MNHNACSVVDLVKDPVLRGSFTRSTTFLVCLLCVLGFGSPLFAQVVVPTDFKPGWTWYVGIGVDDYRDPNIVDLKYCAADVTAVEAAVEQQAVSRRSKFITEKLTDRGATVQRVESSLQNLERFVAVDDTVVIMFSGHAMQGRRGLYLLTTETRTQTLQGTSVNWQTLAKSIAKIKAKRILVLLDACHSGAFSDSSLPIQEEFRKQLRSKDGVLVLASSSGLEVSEEVESEQHGAFTTALTSAISGKADLDGVHGITVVELLAFVKDRVAELTQNRQHPDVVIQRMDDSETLFKSGQ